MTGAPQWRSSLDAADERWLRRCAPPKPRLGPGETPDLKHCLAVVRALGGHGFPHPPNRGAAT